MSEDICKVMSELSSMARVWITRQEAVGEESLTDWLLFSASERLARMRYIKFNRMQEARDSGADWEWGFVGQKESLALSSAWKKSDSQLA